MKTLVLALLVAIASLSAAYCVETAKVRLTDVPEIVSHAWTKIAEKIDEKSKKTKVARTTRMAPIRSYDSPAMPEAEYRQYRTRTQAFAYGSCPLYYYAPEPVRETVYIPVPQTITIVKNTGMTYQPAPARPISVPRPFPMTAPAPRPTPVPSTARSAYSSGLTAQ